MTHWPWRLRSPGAFLAGATIEHLRHASENPFSAQPTHSKPGISSEIQIPGMLLPARRERAKPSYRDSQPA
jgi:hypothetical protein